MNFSRNDVRGLLSSWCGKSPPLTPRRRRQVVLSPDCLERREVLSSFGFGGRGLAAARLAQASQVGSLSAGGGFSLRGGRGGPRGFAQDAELAADLEQYRADVNVVLLGSSATDAQRQALGNDFRAIEEAGFEVDKDALAAVADDLLEALADDTLTTEEEATIQDAFNALFAGSTVDQALIDQAFDDFVAVADNLDIDETELSTLAADREAIAADYARLGIERSVPSNLDLILSSRGGSFRGACR